MKQRLPHSKRVRATDTPRLVSHGRVWLFRIVALLLPVLLLGLVEIGLRLAGYGYATSFFRKTRVGGREFLVNNDTFSLRFFPPELARWPGTLMIPAMKPPDTVRIFIFGESAAMGDPQPAYGASRYLEVLLRERFPGKKFEVVNVAFTAISSHVILPIARECAKQNGDIWIVYMGNNEMVGPFGAATIFGRQAPPLSLVRFNLAIQQTRVGQLAMATMRKLGGKAKNSSWGGMQMFLQNQIPPDDPRRTVAYRNFESNLRDVVSAGLHSGAKVILNTMSVNLKDCPPFASLGNSNLPPADQVQFAKLYAEGCMAEKDGNGVVAAQRFEQAAKQDPNFAELQYRWADCLLRASNATARAHYQLACDLDALPFRADSRVNESIRRVGGEFPGGGLVLSDAESVLANDSPFGISGQEAFFEHVHFSFLGNYRLGRLWAEEVARVLPKATSSSATNWATQAVCERDLGLTLWNRSFVLDSVMRRMAQPPLSSQFNNPARLAAIQAESKFLRAQQDTNAVMRSGQELVDAIQRAPRDPFLPEGLANLYEALGDLKRAVGAYREVHNLLPHDFYCNLQLGRLLGKLGQPVEGENLLRQAAGQRPSVPEVWGELGDICMRQNKFHQALAAYERALELRPQDAAYVGYVATALARLNRRTEAIAIFRRAFQLRPDFWEAHFELGGVLAADNQLYEAQREYAEAIRLNPRHAGSRINFGVILVRQNRLDEAIRQFEAALQIEPQNGAAADCLHQITERRHQKK